MSVVPFPTPAQPGPFAGLTPGRYAAILADPPWRFETYSAKGRDRLPDAPMNNRPERHYATLTLDEVKALPVAHLAARDCTLFLWATDSMLPQALDVGRAWGFTFKTVAFYWMKLRKAQSTRGLRYDESDLRHFPLGTGYWTRPNPEQCLLFTRGSPRRIAKNVRKLIVAQRREHSRKPDETHDRIRQLVAGPYLELFSRQIRPGWECWGNETTKYNPADDFDRSINACYEAVRERKASGGPGWPQEEQSEIPFE